MTQSTNTPPPGHDRDPYASTEGLAQRLSESAQQVWLAGLGAFNRAQAEGSKLFDSLVKDGEAYEQRQRSGAGDTGNLRDSVQSGLGQARQKGARTWEKVETVLDDQVQSILRRLQVPSREDISELQSQIQGLQRRLGELEARQANARTVIPAAPQTTPETRDFTAGSTGN